MTILRVRYFAALREGVGRDGETVVIPDDVSTVAQVRALLASRGGGYEQALGSGRTVRAALNLHIVGDDAVISGGGELAFFPPVTGG